MIPPTKNVAHPYHTMALPKFQSLNNLGKHLGTTNSIKQTEPKKTIPKLNKSKSMYQSPVWFLILNGLKSNMKILQLTLIASNQPMFFRLDCGRGKGVRKKYLISLYVTFICIMWQWSFRLVKNTQICGEGVQIL